MNMKLPIFTIIIGATFLSQWAGTSDIATCFNDDASKSEYHRRYTDDYNDPIILENLIIQTISGTIRARSSFNITFTLPPSHKKMRFELQPSHDTIAPDAYIQHIDKQGRARWAGLIDRSIHRVFKGVVFSERERGNWKNLGWTRIYVIRDGAKPLFRGTFSIDGEQYHVQPQSTYIQMKRGLGQSALEQLDSQQDDYVIAYKTIKAGDEYAGFKRSPEQNVCRVNSLTTHIYQDSETTWSDELSSEFTSPLSSTRVRSKLLPRQWGNPADMNFISHIGSTAGCSTSRRIALLGIAADCSYTASFTSAEAAHRNIISVVNAASEVFERSFNVSLQIQNITITDPECPATAPDNASWNVPCATGDLSQRLNLFSQWRGSISDNLAYWTLMTNCSTNSEVGIAWVGELCNSPSSSSQLATGASVVVHTPEEWQVFA